MAKTSIYLIFGLVCLLDSGSARADAVACPTAGTVAANETWGPIAAGDYYDCRNVDITINPGVTLSLAGNTGSGTGVEIQTRNLTVQGSISASGMGYPGSTGPGAGQDYGAAGSGAGHGGAGAPGYTVSGGIAYGSLTQPVTLGSGGGKNNSYNAPGGTGGGAIKLVVSGILTLDGSITANGNNGGGDATNSSGAGSGGSIWIDTGTLAGNGTISARGGSSQRSSEGWGDGGGGRIALYYSTKTFSGAVTVAAVGYGAVGTVFQLSGGEFNCSTAGTVTFTAGELAGVSSIIMSNNCSTTINGDLTLSGNVTVGSGSAATLTINGNLTANFATVDNGSVFNLKGNGTFQQLTVTGNSTLTAVGNTGTGAGVVITAPNLAVGSGSTISANGRGYPGSAGPGAGQDYGAAGSGAGHGGAGAPGYTVSGGITYGSLTQPVTLGSGGGKNTSYNAAGGTGGGAIKFVISGTLTVNGSVTANGNNGGGDGTNSSGAGSGGSIWIDAGTLAGNGSISARGGNSQRSSEGWGDGGGGRIALYYSTKTFSGTVTVAAVGYGAVGTIYDARTGKFVSSVIDFSSSAVVYQTLSYSATTPGTTTVSVDLRAGNTAAPDGTWTDWNTVANGGSLALFAGNRYLQYRVTLGTTDANRPSLDSLTINAPACYSTNSYYSVRTTGDNQFKYARSNTATNVAINSNVPASTNLKALVSFDGGTTWKKHNGTTWVDTAGVSTIGTTGNTMAEFQSGLNNYGFGSASTVDFAFGLEADTCTATPSVTELRFDY